MLLTNQGSILLKRMQNGTNFGRLGTRWHLSEYVNLKTHILRHMQSKVITVLLVYKIEQKE